MTITMLDDDRGREPVKRVAEEVLEARKREKDNSIERRVLMFGTGTIAATILPATAGGQTAAGLAATGFALGGEPISEEFLLLSAMDSDAVADGLPSPTANAFASFLAIRERSEKRGESALFQKAEGNLKVVLEGIRDRRPADIKKLRKSALEIGRILSDPAYDAPACVTAALQIPARTIVRYLLAQNGGNYALRASPNSDVPLVQPGDIVLASGLMLREEGRAFWAGDYFRSTERRHFEPGEVDEEWRDEKTGWVHFTLDSKFHESRADFERAYLAMCRLSILIGGIGFKRYLPMLHSARELPNRLKRSRESDEALRTMEEFGRYRISGPGQLLPHPHCDGQVLVDLVEEEKVETEVGDPPQKLLLRRQHPERYEMPRPNVFGIFELSDGSLMLLSREMQDHQARTNRRNPFEEIMERLLAGGVLLQGEEAGEFRFSLKGNNGDPSIEEIALAFGGLGRFGFHESALAFEPRRVLLVQNSSLP